MFPFSTWIYPIYRGRKKSVEHFVNLFCKDGFRYFKIVFTGKESLEDVGGTFEIYLKHVSETLKAIIRRCNLCCIAFNNRAPKETRGDQDIPLLTMVDDIIAQHEDNHYSNEMFVDAEKKMIRQREIEKSEKDSYS